MSEPRSALYLWLAVVISAVAFVGFSFTYFKPILAGQYPAASATVHVHGWTFFLWYLLLPLQAGLIAGRRVSLHRLLGKTSVVLMVAAVGTGLVVIGHQMQLAQGSDGNPFFAAMGPAIFVTLVLFAGFYALAFRFRHRRDLHKRLMLLSATGGLGAAAFRVVGQVIGFGPAAAIAGILAPNLIALAAMLIEGRRDGRWHQVYRWGIPISFALEAAAIFGRQTPLGDTAASALAWIGRLLAPLY